MLTLTVALNKLKVRENGICFIFFNAGYIMLLQTYCKRFYSQQFYMGNERIHVWLLSPETPYRIYVRRYFLRFTADLL